MGSQGFDLTKDPGGPRIGELVTHSSSSESTIMGQLNSISESVKFLNTLVTHSSSNDRRYTECSKERTTPRQEEGDCTAPGEQLLADGRASAWGGWRAAPSAGLVLGAAGEQLRDLEAPREVTEGGVEGVRQHLVDLASGRRGWGEKIKCGRVR